MIACVPAVSDWVVHVATPLARGTPLHPGMALLLSVKLTVPVGESGPWLTAVTVAVNVTESLTFDGFLDDCKAVLLAPMLTVWRGSSKPLPGAYVQSPL